MLSHVPFDSARKFSAVTLRGGSGNGLFKREKLVLVKGAPEKLLSACTRYLDENGEVCPLASRQGLESHWKELTRSAMRVLALAVSDEDVDERGDFSRLILIGLVGIRDEVREEARAAVRQVHNAGIQVVMITGDNKDTAAAIAREAGLLSEKGTAQRARLSPAPSLQR